MSKKFDKALKDEVARLTPYFTDVAPEKKALADGLIQNSAFMRATMDVLQEQIKEEGATDEYKNGNSQSGMKISAATQSYNSFVRNYMGAIKTLNSLLPKETPKINEKRDALAELLDDE